MPTIAEQLESPGVVFTLTADLGFISEYQASKRLVPGAHLITLGTGPSGQCVGVFNTFTGRTTQLMLERWVTDHVRIIGRVME